MLSTRLTLITILAAARCWSSAVGQLYDVACPGVNSELQCSEGQVIRVQSMEYGDKSSVDCAARSEPAATTKGSCLRAEALTFAEMICNHREHCRLSKPNQELFHCDYSEDSTFIQITYYCIDRGADVQTVVKCEGGEAEISCETGVIDILSAQFGRFDEKTCTSIPSDKTYCVSPGANRRVKRRCNNQRDCEVRATTENLGFPITCDFLSKYLIVDYVCK
ncbi:L-rhamnose-binding lectin CSL2-like [Chelmon rostratus]|uniref:L-rhamnose-binding lectin CSL2-like n=1 Tax=Chelmon rostratus TaxID=109905 RepID=UPI001BEC4417|nr:L-rhamnose-binding lectin CSL2-like [Chelmon rostratus]